MCEWKKLSQYPVCAGLDCITWTKIFSHVSKDDLEPIDFLCAGLEGENSTEVKESEVTSILITSLHSTVEVKRLQKKRATKEMMV